MNFTDAIQNQSTRTQNGMKARLSTTDDCTDLFFQIGAMRGKNPIGQFTKAFVQNQEHACRIALWARDIRGGAGERQIFRDILLELSEFYPGAAMALMEKVPELGRIDDLLLDFNNKKVRDYGFGMIKEMIDNGNRAKNLLDKFDSITEEQAKNLLKEF